MVREWSKCDKIITVLNAVRHTFFMEEHNMTRIVVTIVGKDKVGITAAVSKTMADNNVNILNIDQNIVSGFFNMVLIGDIEGAKVDLKTLQAIFTDLGKKLGVEIRVQSEAIFTAMHAI
jgi:ACT domain-containing protein